MEDFTNKPFVVVDLGSGSYLLENEGHEKYNEVPNPKTGKYYGYAPAKGNLDITKLGAKKTDSSVSGVLVIYVKREEDSNNRYISSYIPDATIYKSPQIDEELERTVLKDGKITQCSFCIVSEYLHIIPYPAHDKFVINIKDYSISMFRKQRFYKGTYPELDRMIIHYIESISSAEIEPDDALFQQALQAPSKISVSKMKHNASIQPEYLEGSNGKQVKKKIGVSKAALLLANHKCETSTTHNTFINSNGVPYMEGHHLIPCTPSNAVRYWKKYGVNIDCVENIVCLCPTCHRLLHYGNREDRNALLTRLFSDRKERLEEIGLKLTLNELKSLYK